MSWTFLSPGVTTFNSTDTVDLKIYYLDGKHKLVFQDYGLFEIEPKLCSLSENLYNSKYLVLNL
jgi:hypothetical protein